MAIQPRVLHGAAVAPARANTSLPVHALSQVMALIAPRLSPETRLSLASTARVVRDHPEIQRTLATDRARVGFARVATPTTLGLALDDIGKCPVTEHAQLLEELAPRLGGLAPRSSLLGTALFLEPVFALPPSERSGPVAGLISQGTFSTLRPTSPLSSKRLWICMHPMTTVGSVRQCCISTKR